MVWASHQPTLRRGNRYGVYTNRLAVYLDDILSAKAIGDLLLFHGYKERQGRCHKPAAPRITSSLLPLGGRCVKLFTSITPALSPCRTCRSTLPLPVGNSGAMPKARAEASVSHQ